MSDEPMKVYVNSAWADKENGEQVETKYGSAIIGTDAFAAGDDALTIYGGNTSNNMELVFLSGGSLEKSITGFNRITLNPNYCVTCNGSVLEEVSIHIDASDFSNCTKRILVNEGGCDDASIAVTVDGGFGHQFLDDGKTLVITSPIVVNTYANTDWTQADIQNQFEGDILLVWDKNSFNSISTAAANLGDNGTLYLQGGTSSESVNLTGTTNDIWITGNTTGTACGSLHGNGGTLYVENNNFTVNNISGFSNVEIMGSLSVTSGLDFDVTNRPPSTEAMLHLHADAELSLKDDATLTVTLSPEHISGTFTLTSGISDLDRSISVLDQDKHQICTLTVGGGTTIIDNMEYTLAMNGSSLTLTAVLTGDLNAKTKDITDYMTANDVNVNKDACLNIHDGGTAENTMVNKEGTANIFNNGTANSTTVNSGGVMNVFNDGTANSTTVNDGGVMDVSSDGTANITTVNSDGSMLLSSMGTANSTTLNGGKMFIESQGTANSTTVNNGGYMSVTEGAKANSTTVNSGGTMIVDSDGVMGAMTINDGAVVSACDGSIIEFNIVGLSPDNVPLVNDLSRIDGNPSLSLRRTAFNALGNYILAEGAEGFNKEITVGTTTHMSDEVNFYFINEKSTKKGCYTFAENSGKLELKLMEVVSAAWNNKEFKVEPLTCLSDTTPKGNLIVSSNALTYLTRISKGGSMLVSSGGTANNTTIQSGGIMSIENGAKVISTTISKGGSMNIVNGTAKTTTVRNGGNMFIDGVKLTGALTIYDSGTVTANEGSTIDFDISALQPDSTPIINNLSLIQGAPSYAVTVKANQTRGDYLLAEGAAEFTDTLTVKCGSEADVTITVGEDFIAGGNQAYALALSDGQLVLTVKDIDIIPPDAPSITLSGNAKSHEAVLTAAWDASDAVCLYAVDNTAALQEYAEPLKFTSDAHVWFQTKDDAGNTTDRRMDLMFGSTEGTWGAGYRAWRVGMTETAELEGLNIISNIVDGSDNATILVLTDDANGDALFMDDIYNGVSQARLSKVNEIFAGAGNDVIDMTSPRFDYKDDGITVHGGDGDDVVWANDGTNLLFGDAGKDRIIGGANDDTIVGGAGNDTMHGGGGNDTFCFGGNWGKDTVTQNGGTVTLWFQNGDDSKWNASKLTYTDGKNSVTVKGVAEVTLKFGDDNSRQYKELLAAGAFDAASSDKLFGGMGACIAST